MKALKYALNGLKVAFFTQINLKIHVILTLLAVISGLFFGINKSEWLAIVLCTGLVISTELLNTAIEMLVDKISPEKNEMAGKIKDVAAGAVLLASATALVCACLIFLPYLIKYFD